MQFFFSEVPSEIVFLCYVRETVAFRFPETVPFLHVNKMTRVTQIRGFEFVLELF